MTLKEYEDMGRRRIGGRWNVEGVESQCPPGKIAIYLCSKTIKTESEVWEACNTDVIAWVIAVLEIPEEEWDSFLDVC